MSTGKLIAIGVGAAGLYICYKKFTSGSSIAKQVEADRSIQSKKVSELGCEATDIYVLHSDADIGMAKTFRENILRNVSTEDVEVVLKDDVGHGLSVFQAFDQGLETSIYTFVFVTNKFLYDDLEKFKALMNLMKNLKNRKWKLVPVWVDPGIADSTQCPDALTMIHGLHYDRFLGEGDTSCFESIDKLLSRGRESMDYYEK